MKNKKLWALVSIIFISVVGGLVFFLLQKKPEPEFKLEEPTKNKVTKPSVTVDNDVAVTEPQAELEKTLEKPDTPASNSDKEAVESALTKMLEALSSKPDIQSIVPSREDHDLTSYRRDLSNIKEKMILGFTYDAKKTKVFESNLEGTVQFTFTLTDGKSVLVYSANYDTLTEQIELATYREGDN